MSDKYIEKSLLYLITASLLLHISIFVLFNYLPQPLEKPAKEPVFVDLQQIPEIKQRDIKLQQDTKRHSDKRVRVEKEQVPKDEVVKDLIQNNTKPSIFAEQKREVVPNKKEVSSASIPPTVATGSSIATLLKAKATLLPQLPSIKQLFPSANRLAKLEESYRRKFEDDIAEGDTKFLNSDDILFDSFLRRFEGAVYGVWRYPQEAAMRGIEGVTPVRITFNRKGDITNIELLESSGSVILDDEVRRTLSVIGSVGSFPRSYDKDEFHLIAFFQYGGARRSLR